MGNPVVHFEIAGPDGPALMQFYRDLFGWNVQTQGEEMGNYGLVQTNEGGIGGGIMETTEDMPVSNYVTFYIQVDDLRTALDKLSGMGGAAVMPPMEIAPGMGSIATFTDPRPQHHRTVLLACRMGRRDAARGQRPAGRAF